MKKNEPEIDILFRVIVAILSLDIALLTKSRYCTWVNSLFF